MNKDHIPMTPLPFFLLVLLLPRSLLAWRPSTPDCIFIAGQGPCYVNRSAPLHPPPCQQITTHDQADVVVAQSIHNWFKITDFRRQELHHYATKLPLQNHPLQLLLDGSCSNKLDVVHKFIVVGGNLLRPWINAEIKRLLNGIRINTIVMFMSYWSALTLDMQSLVVKHIHLHLEMYGRFILIGDGTVKRTTDDFHALLEFGTGFTARQYMLVGGNDDESMKLHFGLSRVWAETIVVSATKIPITTSVPGVSILPLHIPLP